MATQQGFGLDGKQGGAFQGYPDRRTRFHQTLVDNGHTSNHIINCIVNILSELPSASSNNDRSLWYIHGIQHDL